VRLLACRVLLVVALVAATAVSGGWWMWQRLQTPYQGFEGAERFVEIPQGTSTAGIGRRLATRGVVADAWTFRAAVWWVGRARALKAGEYRFEGGTTPIDVVVALAEGRVYSRALTFPRADGGRDGRALRIARVRQQAGLPEGRVRSALIADLAPSARDLEGYLFPRPTCWNARQRPRNWSAGWSIASAPCGPR
jgi:cell division protein YceG involved in septum cleavage